MIKTQPEKEKLHKIFASYPVFDLYIQHAIKTWM